MQLVDFLRRHVCPTVETQGVPLLAHSGRVQIASELVGKVGAEHLLGLHFGHLGFVTFEDNALEALRRISFQRAVKAVGGKYHHLKMANLVAQVAALPRPMGLMAADDANAINVIRALTDAGWKVPEEYAVVGVDDTKIVCELAPVPLSSVNCDYERQGYEAAALLDRLMEGEPVPAEPIIIAPQKVTVRRSTDLVALEDFDSARFLRFLRDHYLEPDGLQKIARFLGVSLRKVQANFRQHLGRGLLDELTSLRVEHAKKLLRESKLKIETVGLESGFRSRFHFIRAFHRITGETPKSYRGNQATK